MIPMGKTTWHALLNKLKLLEVKPENMEQEFYLMFIITIASPNNRELIRVQTSQEKVMCEKWLPWLGSIFFALSSNLSKEVERPETHVESLVKWPSHIANWCKNQNHHKNSSQWMQPQHRSNCFSMYFLTCCNLKTCLSKTLEAFLVQFLT